MELESQNGLACLYFCQKKMLNPLYLPDRIKALTSTKTKTVMTTTKQCSTIYSFVSIHLLNTKVLLGNNSGLKKIKLYICKVVFTCLGGTNRFEAEHCRQGSENAEETNIPTQWAFCIFLLFSSFKLYCLSP